MFWLVLLGLISIAFIFVGWNRAVRHIRRQSQEEERRRARAFAEMMKMAEEKNLEHRK
jgi:hypothetical protein